MPKYKPQPLNYIKMPNANHNPLIQPQNQIPSPPYECEYKYTQTKTYKNIKTNKKQRFPN